MNPRASTRVAAHWKSHEPRITRSGSSAFRARSHRRSREGSRVDSHARADSHESGSWLTSDDKAAFANPMGRSRPIDDCLHEPHQGMRAVDRGGWVYSAQGVGPSYRSVPRTVNDRNARATPGFVRDARKCIQLTRHHRTVERVFSRTHPDEFFLPAAGRRHDRFAARDRDFTSRDRPARRIRSCCHVVHARHLPKRAVR